jgi:circadian clock protein KaiB
MPPARGGGGYDFVTREHVLPSSVTEYLFELYVAGDGIRARTAVEALTRMCDERLSGRYAITVIDVLVHPEEAESAKILATPTLLRRRPEPDIRIIGDLQLTQRVLDRLGVPQKAAPSVQEVPPDA